MFFILLLLGQIPPQEVTALPQEVQEETITAPPLQEPAVQEEPTTAERQQEIEAAVEEIKPAMEEDKSTLRVEAEEEEVESKDDTENIMGRFGQGKHVYKEALKNKQIVYVVGKFEGERRCESSDKICGGELNNVPFL